MSEKILVPVLGESISEATVAKWLKRKGESIEADEPIVELETDKVNLEVPSPISGVLSEINAKDGQVVEVGAILGLIAEGKNQTSEKIISSPKKKIENIIEDKNEKSPNFFDKKIINLEQSSSSKQNHEKPLILNTEAKEESEIKKNPQNEVLSPAVRKIAKEKSPHYL